MAGAVDPPYPPPMGGFFVSGSVSFHFTLMPLAWLSQRRDIEIPSNVGLSLLLQKCRLRATLAATARLRFRRRYSAFALARIVHYLQQGPRTARLHEPETLEVLMKSLLALTISAALSTGVAFANEEYEDENVGNQEHDEVLASYDADGDGLLSRSEVAQHQDISAQFDSLDVNSDGLLGEDELDSGPFDDFDEIGEDGDAEAADDDYEAVDYEEEDDTLDDESDGAGEDW